MRSIPQYVWKATEVAPLTEATDGANPKPCIYPADQAPYTGTGKHFIGDFMNQPTNAMQGSVGVACKLSHSVLYVKMQRVKRGHYDLTFIPICDVYLRKIDQMCILILR